MGEGAGGETVLIRGRPVVTPEQTCPVDLFLSPEILNLASSLSPHCPSWKNLGGIALRSHCTGGDPEARSWDLNPAHLLGLAQLPGQFYLPPPGVSGYPAEPVSFPTGLPQALCKK